MAGSEYYSHSTYPSTGSSGSSSAMRAELELIEAGFALLPTLIGTAGGIVVVNAGGTAMTVVAAGTTTQLLMGGGASTPPVWADNLPVASGGTGRATSTTAYGLIAAGTTATGAHQTLAAGATTEVLVGGGASALPVWTTATGSGAPVRATSPVLTTPNLGTPSALVGTSITGTGASFTAGQATAALGLKSATTTVSVSAATAPSAGQILTATNSTTATWQAAPVTLAGSEALTNKTYSGIKLSVKETVYTITDAAAFEIDPANGGIQKVTLGASRTPKGTNFASGQSVTLKIADGTAYTITWTDASLNPTWVDGVAPTLATSGYSIVVLWKDADGMYGKYMGDVA